MPVAMTRAEGDEQHDDGDEQAGHLVALDLFAGLGDLPEISVCTPASRAGVTASTAWS